MEIFWFLMAALALVLIGRWTDSKGWTALFRASGRRTAETSVSVLDDIFHPSAKVAIEYRVQQERLALVEDEGEDKDPTQARPNPADRAPPDPGAG